MKKINDLKIKGNSYHYQRKLDFLRYAGVMLAFIIASHLMMFTYYTLEGLNAQSTVVKDITDEYIICDLSFNSGGPYYYHVPITEDTPTVFIGMPVITYVSNGLNRISAAPFYTMLLGILLMVYFIVRFFMATADHRKEKKKVASLYEYGRRYDAKYEDTEKLKGIKNYRIKVSSEDPFTKEITYYYSTTLTYDPKLFIPSIENITVYVATDDPQTYFVDFHGAILSNEAIHGR